MLKQFMDLIVITLLSIAGLTDLLRLIYLIFKLKIFDKFTFISNAVPSKSQLMLYYILTIVVCIYAVNIKLGNF
jgi:hypothetical protein